VESLKKRARERERITVTEVWEDGILINKKKRTKILPPDPDAIALLKKYQIE
jgi:hypothetical protein